MVAVQQVLSTAFAVVLFIMFAMATVNPTKSDNFQQYKVPIMATSAFLTFAIFGIPYMSSDAAQSPPTFEFLFTGLTILVVVGVVGTYIFNMNLDSYITTVSAVAMFAVVISRITDVEGGAGDVAFPAFARELLIFFIVGGVMVGLRRGAMTWQPDHPQIQQLLGIYVALVPVALCGLVAWVLYRSIRELVQYRASRKPCSTPGAAGVGASAAAIATAAAPFEAFQDGGSGSNGDSSRSPEDVAAELNTKLLPAAIDRIQAVTNDLLEMTDSTCAIVREVENGYIGFASAPPDESELSLSREDQDARRLKRQEKGKQSFDRLRRVFHSQKKTQSMECFQNEELLKNVREQTLQLYDLMTNPESYTLLNATYKNIVSDILFSTQMITKSEGFQSTVRAPTPAVIPTATATAATVKKATGSYDEDAVLEKRQVIEKADTATLLTTAKDLVGKVNIMYADVENAKTMQKSLQSRIGKVYQKATMIGTGNYTMQQQPQP